MRGYEWSFQYLWHWMNWFQRLDVIVLALMLANVVIVVTRVSYKYRLARSAEAMDTASKAFQRGRRKLLADLNLKVSTLKSIAFVAPYLGLSGTCTGLITGFRGIGLVADSALAAVMAAGVVPVAFITTVAGLIVAIPAGLSYNYLRTRIDLLESEVPRDAPVRRSRPFAVTQKPPLAALFSIMPFPLIAAPTLAILAGVVFMEYSSYQTAMGLSVSVVPARCKYQGDDRLIVLHVTNAGKLLINNEEEDWKNLAHRLSEIYSVREHRTLDLLVDKELSFQTAADVIDIVAGAESTTRTEPLNIEVRLISPAAINAGCAAIPSRFIPIPLGPT